jgi:CRP/FNR family transcriptional regulator, cyclic AMP receptor protein
MSAVEWPIHVTLIGSGTIVLTHLSNTNDPSSQSRNNAGIDETSSSSRHSTAMAASDELLTIERVAVLQRVGLLSHVPGNKLIAVARLLEEVRVASGVNIIERGAVEDWLFIVADGKVRVHVDDRTLVESGRGAVVGELAVLAPGPRSASVTALEPTLLLRLRRGPFEELLDDRPEIARAVISRLAHQLQAVADERAGVAQA